MMINLNDLRVVKVEAGNPIGFEPGWYAFREESHLCWGPFSNLGEWSDWVMAHKKKAEVKA